MALTLDETRVSINETFSEMLQDLQGHILKHHGRTFAYHVFVKFNPAKINLAKAWIKSFAEHRITSAEKQIHDAAERKLDKNFDGGTFFSLSLTSKGYDALGMAAVKPNHAPFNDGMKSKEARLSDDVSGWETTFKDDLHALIIIADSAEAKAKVARNKVLAELLPFASLRHSQKGIILTDKNGIGIEHFGYADGVSQPIFLEEEIAAQAGNQNWHDQATLKLALVKDAGGKFADSFGSFLVFRKLEQNVRAFKAAEDALPDVLNNHGLVEEELPGAMIVGRFEDGTETVNSSKARGNTKSEVLVNDFNYGSDPDALKCPFHAHIRIVNPRNGIKEGVDEDFSKSVRIVRRGIPFNEIGRNVNDLEHDNPTHGVGLLFMCYQADIERQFEFLQATWANGGQVGAVVMGQDGVIGQGRNDTQKFLPVQWNNPVGSNPIDFKHFVKNLGGEYFFTPSISSLL